MKKLSLLFLISIFFLLGCGTSKTQYQDTERMLRQRNFQAAIQKIKAAKEDGKYKKKDRVLYYLDLGMLYHYNGDYQKSNEMLTKAERAIEDLYTKSISKEVKSWALNDNSKAYSGEDYEDIYTNVFMSLNYINMGKYESAMVEARRINEKINLLMDRYRQAEKKIDIQFSASALAHYLSLLLYRDEERNFDSARIDAEHIQKAFERQPDIYKFQTPELPKHSPPPKNKAYLNIVSFAGLGPDKVAKTLRIQTLQNSAAIVFSKGDERYREYFSATAFPVPGMPPGYHFKFEFPEIKMRKNPVRKIVLKINNKPVSEFQRIEDISRIAQRSFEYKLKSIVGKTLTRAAVKYAATVAATEATKKATGSGGLLGAAMSLGASAAASATEQADLRLSYFFPGNAYFTETLLKPGEYNIEIVYYKKSGGVWVDKRSVKVLKGKPNIINSFYF